MVDTTNLEAGDAQDLGGRGFEVLLGGDRAYAVDRGTGVVKLLDADLRPVGSPVRLGGELGSATVDRDGTLWVVRLDTGEVIAVHGRTLGKPSRYGRAGDRADLSLVDGQVVVVNHDQGTVGEVTEGQDVDAVMVVTGGAELRSRRPRPARSSSSSRPGPGAPLVARRRRRPRPAGRPLGPRPGPRGRVRRFRVPPRLHDRRGDDHRPGQRGRDAGARLRLAPPADLFEKDGFVWVNDPAGAEALVIDATRPGRAHREVPARLPGLTPPSSATTDPEPPTSPPAPPTPAPSAPATSAPPTTVVAPSTTTTTAPPTTLPPEAPPPAPVVHASAGDATVDASWTVAPVGARSPVRSRLHRPGAAHRPGLEAGAEREQA